MTLGSFVVGSVLLAVAVGPAVIGAWQLRRRLLPSWSGAPARLAEIVLAIAVLLAVEQLFGAVGLFRRVPVVAGCALAGTATALLAGYKRPALLVPADPPPPRPQRPAVVAAVAMAAGVTAQWTSYVSQSLSKGITDYDSLHYHLPIAARFVQDGWITRLHFTSPDFPNMFHPSNSELLHGLGMLCFKTDVLSPVLNLGWLALAFLAGWCVGRPAGVGPATLGGVVLLLAPPITVLSAGSALNDVPALACFVAAVAVLLQPTGARGRLVIGGIAAGMAAGMKITELPVVLPLTLGVIVLAGRRPRRADAVAWCGALIAAGGFWYVRNLARAGSPVPSLRLAFGSIALQSPHFALVDQFGYRLVHYATDFHVWRTWLFPGLRVALSPAWWAIVALSAAGVVGAWLHASPRLARMLAVVAAIGVLAYAITPTTAAGPPGKPLFFALNLRYVFSALALGLVLLPLLPVMRPRWQATLLAIDAAVLLATELARGVLPGWGAVLRAWPTSFRRDLLAVALVAGAGVGVVALLRLSRRGPSRAVVIASVVALVVATAVLGHVAQRRYFQHRWADQPLWTWADGLRDQRIAIAGFDVQYPLYGRDLSNRVQYVGRRGPHGEFHAVGSCREWRRLLGEGNYTYVVLEDVYGTTTQRELRWTLADPAARALPDLGGAHRFRLRGPSSVDSCDSSRP